MEELDKKSYKDMKVSGWNDKLEDAAKTIGESAQGYKHMHLQVALESSTQHFWLMLFGMIAGPLAGTLSAIQTILYPDEEIMIPIIVTILGYLSGVIAAIVKFGKYDEVSSANKQAAAMYTSLESNVRRQLALYRIDRINPYKYMEWLEKKYDDLWHSAPLLPSKVYNSFARKAEEKGYYVPDRYSATIGINKEYTDENIRNIMNKEGIDVNNEKKEVEYNDTKEFTIDICPSEQSQHLKKKISFIEPNLKGTHTISRGKSMANFPDLECYSNNMLRYEMGRMMGIPE